MAVRWENRERNFQCKVFFKADLFDDYWVAPGASHELCLQLTMLLDVLNVFASINSQSSTELRYPGPNSEVLCELQDVDAAVAVTYARLATLEVPDSQDLANFWEGSRGGSYFMAPGAVLKEVVEDLEWPQAPVTVTLRPDARRAVSLAVAGHAGELTVDIPSARLTGFHIDPARALPPDTGGQASTEVSYSYKYRQMRAAFCNLPNPKEFRNISTKVSIDANGMMRVVHIIDMDAVPAGRALPGYGRGGRGRDGVQTLGEGRKATVIFVLLPQSEEED